MIDLLLTIFSLFVVVKMAEVFVDQASALSQKLRVSGFVIGFFILALGTSLPELTTSIYSTSIGHPNLAISNIIGSNIANILLVLGVLALLMKYKLHKVDVNRNIPLLLVVTTLFILIIIINGYMVDYISGIIFLLIFLFSLYFIYRNNNTRKVKGRKKVNILYLIASFSLILLFSRICVNSLISLSSLLKIPDIFLGYFILAFGTSLPEFATLYSSLKKGQEEIGIGSIIGSNMFNLLFILGITSFIRVLDLSQFKIELLMVLIATLLLLIFGIIGKKYFLSRREGAALLLFYLLFVLIQILKGI